MQRVVITGATGAIGRGLIKNCIDVGYDVLAVVHRSSPRAGDLASLNHCSVLRLDLNEYDWATQEMEKQGIEKEEVAFFFHLAWNASFGKDREDLDLQLKNVEASLAAVRFAKALGCRTFIGTGSQAEHGRVEGMLSADTPTFPETGYGIAKLCAGQMTRLYCEQLGMRHIWCRVLSVYGPYDRDETLISTAIRRMIRNEDTEFSPCEQLWDYIYADDAARAILLTAIKGKNQSIYVIGSGVARPLKDYIRKIAEITNYKREIGFGKRGYNDKQPMHLQADVSSLKSDTGFELQYCFEEGIRIIVQRFMEKMANEE